MSSKIKTVLLKLAIIAIAFLVMLFFIIDTAANKKIESKFLYAIHAILLLILVLTTAVSPDILFNLLFHFESMRQLFEKESSTLSVETRILFLVLKTLGHCAILLTVFYVARLHEKARTLLIPLLFLMCGVSVLRDMDVLFVYYDLGHVGFGQNIEYDQSNISIVIWGMAFNYVVYLATLFFYRSKRVKEKLFIDN